jgi:hypothetical protein
VVLEPEVTPVFERKEVAENIEKDLEVWEGYTGCDSIVGSHDTGSTTIVRQVGCKCTEIICVGVLEDVEES